MKNQLAYYHLPGLFEFYNFYQTFLPIFFNKPQYFYDNCKIGSIYGSPIDCCWSGGRVENSDVKIKDVINLMNQYQISPRLTFSNSLLSKEHLLDKNCNEICKIFSQSKIQSGIIIASDLLLDYLKEKYPNFYYVSSTTKVILNLEKLNQEINEQKYAYVVIDFRHNKNFTYLQTLNQNQKNKIEFLCNECCDISCKVRKECYENVSKINLGQFSSFNCQGKDSQFGYRFSKAMQSPAFISLIDIQNKYLPLGFNNFKIEGRGLGSALLLEFILYYMTKPEYQINVREELYLDNQLDLF